MVRVRFADGKLSMITNGNVVPTPKAGRAKRLPNTPKSKPKMVLFDDESSSPDANTIWAAPIEDGTFSGNEFDEPGIHTVRLPDPSLLSFNYKLDLFQLPFTRTLGLFSPRVYGFVCGLLKPDTRRATLTYSLWRCCALCGVLRSQPGLS